VINGCFIWQNEYLKTNTGEWVTSCIQNYSWKEHRLLMNVKLGKEVNYFVLWFKFSDEKSGLSIPGVHHAHADLRWTQHHVRLCARLARKMNSPSIMVATIIHHNQQSHLCLNQLIDWNKFGRNTRPVKTYLVFGLVSQAARILGDLRK